MMLVLCLLHATSKPISKEERDELISYKLTKLNTLLVENKILLTRYSAFTQLANPIQVPFNKSIILEWNEIDKFITTVKECHNAIIKFENKCHCYLEFSENLYNGINHLINIYKNYETFVLNVFDVQYRTEYAYWCKVVLEMMCTECAVIVENEQCDVRVLLNQLKDN